MARSGSGPAKWKLRRAPSGVAKAKMIAKAHSCEGFVGSVGEGCNGHFVRATEVADRVERPDLAAARRRERKPMADVKNLHCAKL